MCAGMCTYVQSLPRACVVVPGSEPAASHGSGCSTQGVSPWILHGCPEGSCQKNFHLLVAWRLPRQQTRGPASQPGPFPHRLASGRANERVVGPMLFPQLPELSLVSAGRCGVLSVGKAKCRRLREAGTAVLPGGCRRKGAFGWVFTPLHSFSFPHTLSF